MYKIKRICFGYMNIRGCFNISPLRLRNLWSRKQCDEIPSCLTPRSKWHSFTNMGILCFYSVLHNVYLSWHVRQVHCVSGTGKSIQTQCIGLLSWDKVHFCNSTTNTLTTDQGVDTEKLVDGWGTPYFSSCLYRLPTVRKALSIVCLWWKPSTFVLLLSRYRVLTVPRPKTKMRKTCSIEHRKFSAEYVTSSCFIYNNDKDA